MTGFLGAYADGQDLHGADLTADTSTLAANDSAIVLVSTGGWNALVAGCALAAPGGLVVSVATGQAIAAGVLLAIAAGSVTLVTNSGQVNPRIDVVYAQLLPAGASGTNPGSGNPTKADTYVLGAWQGTNAANPVAPTLPGANYVQLGLVNVPAGATSIASGNLGSQTTAPNARGPLAPVLVTPMTAAGGTGAFMLALTDAHGDVGAALNLGTGTGVYYPPTGPAGLGAVAVAVTGAGGDVGSALALGTGTGTHYPPTTPGGTAADAVAITDGSGRVGKALTADQLGGVAPAGYATLDGNSRVADSEAVRGLRFAHGALAVSAPANGSSGTVACALNDSSFTPVGAVIQIVGTPAFAVTTNRVSLGAGSVSLQVFSDGAAWSGSVDVLAWG